jgi:hypothetical protein
MVVAVADFRNHTGQLMPQVRRKLAHALPVQEVFDIRAADRTCLHFDNDAACWTFGHIHFRDFNMAGTPKDSFFHFHNASLNKKIGYRWMRLNTLMTRFARTSS